ncbi:MAG TPA: SDR family oxidoreductase [Verrucomicrobiae bacterium]|jgi:NAD(P)-dependent dehydrogenase (short-subunit alcohol dehydrogenase family)|nr:SDR family oxidoreductase [Verrucomicrobiae bacterium]
MPTAKVIVITGVTHGLGRALTEEFARRGHTVLGCGRSQKGIDALKEKLGSPHDFYSVDVSVDDAVKSWASICLTTHAPPDLLINNAGVINKNARLWEISSREFSEVIDINVKGTANVIRHFAPSMVKRKSGVIVNLSSGWGRSADAEVAPYCASKWAIEGLTASLAQELPSGMAAVPLNPGIINTEMLQSAFGGSANNYPTAEEWAKIAVPFLLELGPKDNGKQLTVPIRGAHD